MENDIIDSLNDLGYEGPLLNEAVFSKALDGGPKSLEFTKLIHILAEELKKLCNLEETINMMNDPEESSSFLLELSSFLKELGCPYKSLVTGHMSSRLETKEDRLLLLDYLISELMSARMVSVDCPKEKQGAGMEIVMQESPTAKDLKEILIALKFNKPPPNIAPEILFSKLEAKLKDTIQKEGEQLVGKPLYNKALSEKEWKQLENTFTEMFEEYRLRRETLITRLECTIQSFEWSDRLKAKREQIQSAYRPKREQMKVKPNIKLSDFLAARTALLMVDKTSSANVRKNTRSEVNKVIIGRVPDRGGRPNEQQPPPPEMPSWQQRSAPQGGGRGGHQGGQFNQGAQGQRGGRDNSAGRGQGRGGRGGRVQGGYNQGQDQQRPQNQQQNQRNYQTYEVPPGGYTQGYQTQGYSQNNYNQNNFNQGYDTQRGYGQNYGGYGGYDSAGDYNKGYTTPDNAMLKESVARDEASDGTTNRKKKKLNKKKRRQAKKRALLEIGTELVDGVNQPHSVSKPQNDSITGSNPQNVSKSGSISQNDSIPGYKPQNYSISGSNPQNDIGTKSGFKPGIGSRSESKTNDTVIMITKSALNDMETELMVGVNQSGPKPDIDTTSASNPEKSTGFGPKFDIGIKSGFKSDRDICMITLKNKGTESIDGVNQTHSGPNAKTTESVDKTETIGNSQMISGLKPYKPEKAQLFAAKRKCPYANKTAKKPRLADPDPKMFGIVITNQKIDLDKATADKVLISFLDRIMEEASLRKPDDEGPTFKSKPSFTDGCIRLWSTNEKTITWLRSAVSGLTDTSGNQLVVKTLAEMTRKVRCSILIPDPRKFWDSQNSLIKVLEYQNPWLQCDKWIVHTLKRQKDNLFLIVSIPEEIVPEVLKRKRILSCGIGSAYLKFQGPGGKFYGMPPGQLQASGSGLQIAEVSVKKPSHEVGKSFQLF